MGYQSQFMSALFYQGHAATIVVTDGTVCPCTVKYGTYDPQWHIDNPLAEDCNGTTEISATDTTYSVKAIFSGIAGMQQFLGQIKAVEIGQLTNDEILMIGTVDISNMSFINLKNLVSDFDNAKYSITVTCDSVEWLIEHIYEIRADELVCQIALLKRKTSA